MFHQSHTYNISGLRASPYISKHIVVSQEEKQAAQSIGDAYAIHGGHLYPSAPLRETTIPHPRKEGLKSITSIR